MYDFDHQLFLALNFDGGPVLDRLMLIVSGTTMWLPLYALILWLVWRRDGWRNVIVFTVLMVAALVLSDMVSGIFKGNGLLGDLLPGFEPRWRPMFTPSLEGMEIAPDSLRALRMARTPGDWTVHVPVEAVSGRFGTVSAHAAVIVTLAVLSASGAAKLSCSPGAAVVASPPYRVHSPSGCAGSADRILNLSERVSQLLPACTA